MSSPKTKSKVYRMKKVIEAMGNCPKCKIYTPLVCDPEDHDEKYWSCPVCDTPVIIRGDLK